MSTGPTPEKAGESATTYAVEPPAAGGLAAPNEDTPSADSKESDENRLRQDIPWGVRIAAEWSWRIIIILIAAGVTIWLLSHVMLLLIPLLIAGLLASLLRPLHNTFRRLKFPRILASMTSILVLMGGVFGILYLVGSEIVSGFAEMAGQVETGIFELIDWADQIARNFGIEISTEQFNQGLEEAMNWIEENSDAIMSGAAGVGSVAGNIIIGTVLVLFTLIFFLADGRRLWDFMVVFVPAKHRPAIHGAGRRGWTAVGTYMRVQVFVAFVDALGIYIGALILDVPLALPIAVLVFFGGFVPVVGAVVTGAVAVLLAWVAHDFMTALLMLGVVLLVQQIESNVLQPIIMGKAVKLHPLAVVLAVTAGTTLLGLIGALFAVPVLAFIKRATQYLNKEEWRGDADALAMERTVKEEALRRAAQREQLEAEEQASTASLKRRIFETLPVLDPHKHGPGRGKGTEEDDADTPPPSPVPASRDRRTPAADTDKDSPST
ncbi:AI-2E family transporter [Nesterenkonia sphaerica]|uniref:AI-2E family transporter n=1 Tax=Nesterenkonia sphaerica TaxID=1804988 RepID=A0A5R9ADJ8_9MICC|nr:AI-2E family transporter [Nesterenkonia sphaerica]TLP76872.1 AI-2E family transporter [Nesterenkonia sphaerica]